MGDTTFRNGQPCWIDLSVPNSGKRTAICGFYSALFGWTFEVGGAESGYYSIAQIEGKPVAGIGEMADTPSYWTTYLSTADLGTAVETVKANGGTQVIEPMQVFDIGHFAVCQDAVGATVGLWQPLSFPGFARFDEFNAPTWFDHQSADPKRAGEFYRNVFGLTLTPAPESTSSMAGTEEVKWFSLSPLAPSTRPNWTPVIQVDSLARISGELEKLDATILMNDVVVPGGRIVFFADPVVHAPLIAFQLS